MSSLINREFWNQAIFNDLWRTEIRNMLKHMLKADYVKKEKLSICILEAEVTRALAYP